MAAGAWPQLHRRAARVAVLLIGTVMVVQAAPAHADWPTFGHDLSNSRNAGSDGPAAREASSLKQAWIFNSANGDFTGTPVVADGTLVAGTALGTIYGLDAVTGKLRWSDHVGQQINGSAAIDPADPAGPTAFVPVAQVGSPRIVALDLNTGAIRWNAVLSNQPGADVYSSPVYWDGTVYIGTSGPGNDGSTARGSVVAVDESTGKLRWQTFTVPPGHDGGAVWSTPAIDTTTRRLFVGTGNAYHAPAADTTDAMMVLDASTGQILGHYQSVPGDVWEEQNPTGGPDYDFGDSPNLFAAPDGRQLVGEGQKSGTYWALDRSTMQPVWRTSTGPGSSDDGGVNSTGFDATKVYGSESTSGQVFALSRGGILQWTSPDGGTLHVSPVGIGNGVIYSANSQAGLLFARDAATGSVLNTLPLPGPTFGGISLAGRAVYVAVGIGPPDPALPLPAGTTSQMDGNGSIVAFGDTSKSGAGRASSRPPRRADSRRHRKRCPRMDRRHRHRGRRSRYAARCQRRRER